MDIHRSVFLTCEFQKLPALSLLEYLWMQQDITHVKMLYTFSELDKWTSYIPPYT